MRAGHAYTETLVGAQVSSVSEDVPNAHHAPRPIASRAQTFLVEATGDEANADAVAEVKAEDVAHNNRLFLHALQPVLGSHAIAVRRPPQHLTTDSLSTHGR